MRILYSIPILLIPFMTNAQCWVVTNLHGYGSMSDDQYEYGKDAISSGVFQVVIEKDKANLFNVGSSLTGGGLLYVPVSSDTMVGMYHDTDTTTVETWSVTADKKALYSKVINSPSFMSSTKSFVGDVVGSCTTNP